ncbi:MAG: DUF2207 domain-containing protein [Prevotella sp.]|nr:DUF2207 domain-containing protein [Prevotella sp.]
MGRHRIIWLAALLMLCVHATADRGGYHYRNLVIDATVGKDNTWRITETFDIFFDEPRHGFYRYIPRSFKLNHKVDGEVHEFVYEQDIDDISVDNWNFTTGDSNDEFFIIRIGDANREVEGLQQYVISYTLTYPDDRLPDQDYLFHTIVGTEFESLIDHVEFNIEFEKPLPDDIDDLLEVYYGEYGGTDGSNPSLVYQVQPSEIAGQADSVKARHGITLYADLPAGYYEGVKTVNYLWLYLFLAATVIVALLIGFFQMRLRTPHVTKVIEFYPPEDISSAEVGTIIDTSVDSVDIASLIPWLAGKGYIGIQETKKGLIFKTSDLHLTKLKELPDNAPSYQQQFMNLLFGKGNEVDIKEIGENPTKMEKIKSSLRKKFTNDQELTRLQKAFGLYFLLALFGTLVLGTNTVVTTWSFETIAGGFLCFGLPCFCAAVLNVLNRGQAFMRSIGYHTILVIGKAILMLASWALYCFLYIEYGAPLNMWAALAFYIVAFILVELAGRFMVDTDYRAQMMGRLLGFKEFIKTAEKERLVQLQADDPQYFYKVLPYAMVFKLSDKWADLFKDIDVQKPDWYDSATPLMGTALTHNMVHNFSSTVSSAITTISHSSSSGGGGGFSGGGGGGFSGGGGGGGGGGSW